MSGLVYVVRGMSTGPGSTGQCHYGIQYDLVIKDGKLADGSDLWMGSLFWTPKLEVPQAPGKIPLVEWFDYRPIPAITGENTKDPKLLGVDDYLDAEGKPVEGGDPKVDGQSSPK